MVIGGVLLGTTGAYLALLLFIPISTYLGLMPIWVSGILSILTFVMLGFKMIFGGNN